MTIKRVAGFDLVGGEVNTKSAYAVGVQETPSSENLDPLDMKGATTRPGRSKFGIDFGSNSGVKGVKSWTRNSGTNLILARLDSSFYNVSAASWNLVATLIGTTGARFRAHPLLNILAVVVDGSAPQKWDGTTWAALGGSPPANGKYLTTFVSKLWMAGDPANPQTVSFSSTNNGENWTAVNDAGSITAQSGGGDTIQGLMSNRKVLIIMYRHRVEIMSGSTIADFSVSTLTHRGLVSDTGYASLGEVAFFASDEAIYMISGYRLTDLTTQKFREVYKNIADKTKITLGIKAGMLLVCDYGAGKIYACNYKLNKWYTWTNGQYWECMDVGIDEVMYAGFSAASTNQLWNLATTTLDGASAIVAKYRTPNMGFGWNESPKQLAGAFVVAKPGIATLTTSFLANGSFIGASTQSTFAATGDHDWARISAQSAVQAQFLAMEFQWSGVGTVYGWAMYANIQTEMGAIPREA
jgi:hypothetical protein